MKPKTGFAIRGACILAFAVSAFSAIYFRSFALLILAGIVLCIESVVRDLQMGSIYKDFFDL